MPHVVLIADFRVSPFVTIGWLSSCFYLIRKSSCCPTHASYAHSILIYSTLSWSSDLITTAMWWRWLLRSLWLLRVHPVFSSDSKGRWGCCNDSLSDLWECICTAALQCLNSRIIWVASCYWNALVAAFMALRSVRMVCLSLINILSHSTIAEIEMCTLWMLVGWLRFYTLLYTGFRLLFPMRFLRLLTLKSDHVKLWIWEIQILLHWFTAYLWGFTLLWC